MVNYKLLLFIVVVFFFFFVLRRCSVIQTYHLYACISNKIVVSMYLFQEPLITMIIRINKKQTN